MATSYANDIKPLFTQMDRDHMIRARHFDLWSYQDVKTRATPILNAVSPPNPSMPPSNSGESQWTAEMVSLFRQWIADGCPP
jgi:hypothetical protein